MNDDKDTGVEQAPKPKRPLLRRIGMIMDSMVESRLFSYMYMVGILLYLLICGYVLIFAGSLFFEALARGGYRPSAADYDQVSLYLGYLYGFASLCGVLGGLAVISTDVNRHHRFKVLLFVPATVWTVQLVLGNFRWGLEYWTQWLYLVPIMLLCFFVLFGVVKKARIPFFATAGAKTNWDRNA